MNKYFYPIYKMKLKPWIKYWLLKKTSKRLPEEFQEVEFIGMTGKQFIDTGLKASEIDIDNFEILTKVSVLGDIQDKPIFRKLYISRNRYKFIQFIYSFNLLFFKMVLWNN